MKYEQDISHEFLRTLTMAMKFNTETQLHNKDYKFLGLRRRMKNKGMVLGKFLLKMRCLKSQADLSTKIPIDSLIMMRKTS